jgi:flagellar motor switch protein FliN/FliY
MAETTETMEKTEVAQELHEDTDVKAQAQAVEFSEAEEMDASGAGGSVDILLDMTIPVTVAIGQTEIQVRRLLQLGPGSVLKLEKLIDAPADLYLRDTRFATGDVVAVDGRFAVRIIRILGVRDGRAGNASTA